MDSITVGFSKPKVWKPFSWLIMTAYGTPFDHVYIRWHSNSLSRDVIYQASGMAVNFMGAQFFANNVVVDEFEVQLTPANKLAMIQFAMDNAGKPYGIKECFGLAWVRICSLFGKAVANPFTFDGSTYVCSELVGYILDDYAGMDVNKDPSLIDPKMMYNYLLAIKAKQTVSA
jgi:uncharacterized protein YycO